ncbi:MAG: hypothetical protein OQL19_01515 [Gammaproteobacteria bacterium]|nr:hypothetical protein [Gammaproteobacteria bacterium]
MTKPVEITLASRTFTCDDNGKASVIFTISNIVDADVGLAASIYIEENEETIAQKEWFDIKVDPDWTLGSKTTEDVKVDINIPKEQALGDYKFKLTIYAKENPGDDFTTSEMILVKKVEVVPEIKEEKKPFPWWIIAVVVALLIAIGVVWYVFGQESEPVVPPNNDVNYPKVEKLKLSDALNKLYKAGLEVDISKIKKQYNSKLAEEIVVIQLPDPDKTKKVKKGTMVDLTVSTKVKIMMTTPVFLQPIKVQQYKLLKRELEKAD